MTVSDLGQLCCRAGVIDPGDMAGVHVLWVVVATAMPVYAVLALIRRAVWIIRTAAD